MLSWRSRATDAVRQGFARIINYSDESGTVRIYGIDDAGQWAGPVRLSLEAGAGAHFNSADLELGNAGKALSGVLGAGTGSWRLRLYTELDIEALAYVRTADGFVTTMHERVRESAMRHHVAFFNPGGNRSQASRLRLVNPTEEAVEVAIAGRDDAGEPAPGGAVGLTLAPGEARTLSAQALESGGEGMTGSLGDGTGKWQLFISSAASIEVMNLLRSPTGHLSNLSVSSLSDVASVDGVDQPVALNVIVIIPAEVTTVEASDLETTVLGAGTDGAPPGEAPSLLVASDDGGAVMYALVNEDGGLLGEEAGTVRVSVGSTAVVLVAFAAGYRIPSLTPQVVDAILSHADYGVLVRLLTRLMSADKNYLVRLSDYPDVVELLKRVAGSLSAGVALRARPGTGDAAPRTPTTKSADTARSALPHGIYKPGFYCTWALVDLFLPGEWCSPWDEHEPWRWFGNARGAEAYKPDGTGWKDWLLTLPGGVFIESYHDFLQEARQPPFLARSDKEGSREVHAAANPSFIGYAMELYEGSQYVDYYYVPGNATTVDKLQNSGAAYRELLAGRALSLSGNIDRIRFERYRLTATTNDAADYRALVVSFLNTIKLFVSVVNVATDVSVVDDWLREIASTTYYNFRLANCARSLLEHAHPTDPSRSAITQAFALFLDSALASFSTLVTDDACRSVVIEFGGEKLKEDLIQLGIDLGLDGAMSAVTGAKPFADAANELVPVATSYFLAQARSEYHVQWERTQDGQPYIARVSEEALPVAQFSYRQLRDFNVEFDGSESQGEGLRYEWKVAGTPGRISTWEPRQVHDFAHAGTFGVTLTVTDRNGITAEESGQVTVTAGRVPVVSRLTCTPTGEGTEFSMHAEFSDPDDDIESVEWYSHIRNRHPEEVTGAGQRRVTLSAPRDATHTRAKVRVVDALENEAERNCEVEFDPGPPPLSISDASAEEGDSLVFTVRLDPAPAEAVIYWYATYRHTITVDDYEGHGDTQLRFRPGERSKTITVRAKEDSDVEGDETFYVYITDDKDKLPDHGLPHVTDYLVRATGTIRDNVEDDEDDEPAPPAPRRISDASAEEGDSLVFTVRLDRAPAEAVIYWYATYPHTASGDDYDELEATKLRFRPGERSKTITVSTIEDPDFEGDETFYVYITDDKDKLTDSTPSDDYLVRATGTIRDDDDDSTADCPGDREVLVTLYDETGGDRWRRSGGWLTAEPLSNWHGVEVNAEGCVTAVDDLHSNNLRGAIPEELGNLANLEILRLNNNRLTGAIPEELGNLANLEILRLHYNRLAGAIPKELGNLANLESLYLHDNRLTGAIPEELGNLANLERLHLDENQLTGAIPEELGNLANLRTLHLDENRLTGAIPEELGNLANLGTLYLDENQLTGAIPEELGNLANLRTLHLDENRLTGAIPEELGNLANLRALHLDENQLTGAIPEELGNLANLERLHLDENRLTGAIPEELGNLANLGTLYLDENRLTGVLRAQLTNLTRLSRLRFHDNDGLCAPDDASFQSWLQGVPSVHGPTCDTEEAPPRPSISNASAEEGEALVFTVTLDRTPSSAVIYWYATYPHTASGDDYDELEDTELRFGPGERSKTITVSTKEDPDVEGDETFYVYITDDKDKLPDHGLPHETDYRARATGTIRDNVEDDEPAPPAPSISDASAEEGDSLVFTVRLDRAPAEAVIYWYATYPHTASGDDYDELEDTELRFGPGERSKTITVRTYEDSDVEGDETFYVYITDDKDKLTDSTPSEDYPDFANSA